MFKILLTLASLTICGGAYEPYHDENVITNEPEETGVPGKRTQNSNQETEQRKNKGKNKKNKRKKKKNGKKQGKSAEINKK